MKNVVSKLIVLLISGLLCVPALLSADNKILPVSIQSLSDLLINTKNSAPASILSLNNSVISAEITGRIKNIYVEAGDNIKKNKKLVSLDCRSYNLAKKQAVAALQVAKAQFNYATKQFKRNHNLVKQGTIPRQIFEQAESSKLIAAADIELKKAAIETANLAISRCHIYAPFTGQIVKRIAQQGQLVSAGSPLFELIQSDRFEIKANLSPSEVGKIGDSLQLMFVSGDIEIKTTVRSVIRLINETTRTQEIRLSLPKNTQVPAGLSGRLEWSSKEQRTPAEYISRRDNQLGVIIVEDIVEGIGQAKFIALPNAKEGQAVVINLPDDTAVITRNRYRVKDGQKIKLQ